VRAMTATPSTSRVHIGDVITPRNDIIHPRDNPTGSDVFVGLEHIESGTGRRIGSENVEKSELTGRKARFRAGDIVYGYLRPYLNKVWLADFDGLCSVDQYVYVVDERRADAEYIAWLMRSPLFLSRAPVDSGPGQLPRIRLDEIARVELDLPPIPEQKRVATALREQLDAAARMRAAAEAKVNALRVLATASLTGLLSSISARGCVARRCGEVTRVTGGIQKSPSRTPQAFHRPFLTVRNVQRGYLDLTIVEEMEITPVELDRCRLRDGDLLVVEGNGSRSHIGRNALFGGEIDDCIHQNHIIRVRADRNQLNPEFLSLYLNSRDGVAQMVQRARTTTGLYTLSVNKVESLEIPMPGLSEQTALVTRWAERRRTLDSASQAQSRQAAQIGRLPAALLGRAFSGGLRTFGCSLDTGHGGTDE